MNITPTRIEDVKILEPHLFEDERGSFMESYNDRRFRSEVASVDGFVQDNQSHSRRHVLRGLHYQLPRGQAKLVRVVGGEIFDVAIDLRRGSKTFGQWIGTHLSATNRRQLWIPVGFAHGFLALSEVAEVLYKTTDYYVPQDEHTLRWDDPDVGIQWPLEGPPVLSPKDAAGGFLHGIPHFP